MIHNSIFKIITSLIVIIGILSVPLYFSINAFFGYEYKGSDTSSSYTIYIIIVLLINIIIYINTYQKDSRLYYADKVLLTYILYLVTSHFIWIIADNFEYNIFTDNLKFFISLGIVGLFGARVVTSDKLLKTVIKINEIITYTISVSIVVNIIIPFFNGEAVKFLAGTNYQSISYFSAYCIGMIGVYNFHLSDEYRFHKLNNKIVKFISLVLIILLMISLIINGGRGAFILFLTYMILHIYKKINENERGINQIKIIVIMIVSIYSFTVLINTNPIIQVGFERAVSFIDLTNDSLLDVEKTSGRDTIYKQSIASIIKSPLFGYGPFIHWEKVVHPHNIILDIIMQHGIIISIIIFVYIIMTIKKVRYNNNDEKYWIITLMLYPFINLMFSGGYTANAIFWFALYIILQNKK